MSVLHELALHDTPDETELDPEADEDVRDPEGEPDSYYQDEKDE